MILFDGVHMGTDGTMEELFAEARRIGLKDSDVQRSTLGILHFDVWGKPATLVTINCTKREFARRAKRLGGRFLRRREIARAMGGCQ